MKNKLSSAKIKNPTSFRSWVFVFKTLRSLRVSLRPLRETKRVGSRKSAKEIPQSSRRLFY